MRATMLMLLMMMMMMMMSLFSHDHALPRTIDCWA
jgi:hypothetical protein